MPSTATRPPMDTDLPASPISPAGHEMVAATDVDWRDSDAAESSADPGRGVIVVASLVSIVWLAASAAAIWLVLETQSATTLTLSGLAAISAGIAAPLSAIWLAALVIGRRGPAASRATLAQLQAAESRAATAARRTRSELAAIDGLLDTVAARADQIRGTLGTQAAALMEAAAELERRSSAVSLAIDRDRVAIEAMAAQLTSSSGQAHGDLMRLTEVLPSVERHSLSINAALTASADAAKRQIGDIDSMLGSLWTGHEAAETRAAGAIERLQTMVAAVETSGHSTAARIDARAADLARTVDAALARAADALETTRVGVEVQIGAVSAAVDQARNILVDLAGHTSHDVGQRLAGLIETSARLTAAFVEQQSRSAALFDQAERDFAVLDAKLANAGNAGESVLDRLAVRLDSVRAQVHELAKPMDGVADLMSSMQRAVSDLQTAIAETIGSLQATLPGATGRAEQSAHALRGVISMLTAEAAALEQAMAHASAPAVAGRAILTETLAEAETRRVAIEGTVDRIVERLGSARDIVAAIDSGADAAALSATTKLVEAMTRVRDVSVQAEGMMRSTLDKVIGEARDALESASGDAMQRAITVPLADQLGQFREIADLTASAARTSTEQLTRQLLRLVETASAVEQRITQADRKLEEVSRDELARRATLIIDALNSASVDIMRSLSREISDSSWRAYLKGDRSIFTRRAVELVGGGQARAMLREFERDPALMDAVQRYVADFEALMRRITAERDSESLAIALLSSDNGKLYVALAQATERLKA